MALLKVNGVSRKSHPDWVTIGFAKTLHWFGSRIYLYAFSVNFHDRADVGGPGFKY
jgi:hypothetical protein